MEQNMSFKGPVSCKYYFLNCFEYCLILNYHYLCTTNSRKMRGGKWQDGSLEDFI